MFVCCCGWTCILDFGPQSDMACSSFIHLYTSAYTSVGLERCITSEQAWLLTVSHWWECCQGAVESIPKTLEAWDLVVSVYIRKSEIRLVILSENKEVTEARFIGSNTWRGWGRRLLAKSQRGKMTGDKDVMYTGQFNSTSLLLSRLVSASDRKYSCCSFYMLVKPEKVHYGL